MDLDPAREYRPDELARLVGVSRRYIYDLCRARLLGHRRSRPGTKGPITITGAQWLAYRRSCEVRPVAVEGGGAEGPAVEAEPRPRRAGARTGAAGRHDPLAGYLRETSTL